MEYQGLSCKNCQTQLQGPVCHQCGQKYIAQRWSTLKLYQDFIHQITNIEKGFLFTVKALFAFPGTIIRDYWNGKTVPYYNPARYVLIWTALNLLLTIWLGIDDLLQESLQPQGLEAEFGEARVESADQRLDSWMNILVLLLIPVNSLMTIWLFKKSGQNYAEHLILNTYILGQQALFGVFMVTLFYFLPSIIMMFLIVNFLIGWLYNSYVFKQLFQNNWTATILKALAVGVVGILVYGILITIFSWLAILFS